MTLWVAAAKKLPSYMGADMDRQAKQVMFKIMRDALKHGGAMPLMGWDAFIQFCQEQVDAYNDRPHSTLPVIRDPNAGKRRHMSPNEAWAAHIANGWQADTHNEHDAPGVPAAHQMYRRARRGSVPEPPLFEPGGAARIPRRRSPGRLRHQRCAIRVDLRARRSLLQVQLDEVEAERRGHPALTLETPEVITIPGFGDITRDALNCRFVDAEPVIEIEPAAPMATEPEAATVLKLPETPELRFVRWQALHHHIETGGLPDQDELQWYGRYALSKEFAAQKRRAEQAEELPLASHQ